MNMNRKDTIKLLLLSGISIFLGALTILIVYFVTTRQAPTAPPSKPKAAGVCYLEYFFPSPTVTPSVTPTGTPGPTATPTPTPVAGCGQICSSSTPCSSGLICITGTNGSFCSISDYQTACQSATEQTATTVCCQAPSSTPTPTSTVTPTQISTGTPAPTSTPTPTPPPGCYSTCTSDSTCTGSLVCQSISGVNRCVNSSCPYNSNCVCGQAPTSTPTPTTPPQTYQAYVAPPTPTQVVLPQAGVSTPAWTAAGGGALLILLGILFFAL